MVTLFREGIEQRKQEVFVRQHEGGFYGVAGDIGQNLGRQLGLAHRGRNADDVDDGFGKAQRVDGEGLREVLHVAVHEEGGLGGLVADFGAYVVPDELGHAGVPHAFEQQALALVQGVQAHENEAVNLGKLRAQDIHHGLAVLQTAGQGAVHLALIGHVLLAQHFIEVPVNRIQQVPDFQELGFNRRHLSVPEVGQEMVDGQLLVFRKIIQVVLQGLDFLHVLQQALGLHQVFVYVVEVREHHVPPEHEFVQGLRLRVQLLVHPVQFQQQGEFVRNLRVAQTIEEVIDGIQRGHH